MRTILAIISGIICGAFFIAFSVSLAHAAFPADSALPVTLTEQKTFMLYVPFKAKALILIGWIFSAFIAASVTTLIQGRTSWKIPVATASALQLFIWMGMLGFNYPEWMWFFVTVLFIPTAYFGYYFFRKRAANGL